MQTDALLAASRAYVKATATPRAQLATAAGISEADLGAIAAAGALPAPTYVLYADAIHSPIRDLGTPRANDAGEAYYCPSVIWWLRRAALMTPHEDLLPRLEAWFAASFITALREQTEDARRFAWSHLFDGATLSEAAAHAEAPQLIKDWRNGGWAVCLRRWDGRHVVTKDLERARIIALTDDGKRGELSAQERLTLLGAIDRLDSVILPFAPYERPHGTRGLYVDAMRERYGLWR